MTEYPKIIKSGGFILEKVKPSFEVARYLFELVDKQRAYMAEWLNWVDVSNCPEDMYPHLNKSYETKNSNYYIIFENKIVGSISFVAFSEANKMAEIGYWLSRDYNGRGIVTNAVKVFEVLGFKDLGLNRIEIRVDVDNKKSRAIPERLGYVSEGILRKSYILRGVPRDIVVYSKLKSEWEKGK